MIDKAFNINKGEKKHDQENLLNKVNDELA